MFGGDNNKTITKTKTNTKTNSNSYCADSFGIGSGLTGIFSSMSKGTDECGARPVCVFGNCEQKQRSYDACVAQSMNSNVAISANKTKMYIIGSIVGIVVLLVVVSMLKK